MSKPIDDFPAGLTMVAAKMRARDQSLLCAGSSDFVLRARDALAKAQSLQSLRDHPDVLALREAIIAECNDKNSLDPRETDIRGDYHVSLTLTVAEIRAFLIATARTLEEARPAKREDDV